MKKIIFSVLILGLIFTYRNVLAIQECTTTEMTRLKELANNVQFKSNYEIKPYEETIDGITYKSVSLIYNIDILNFDKDLKIKFEGSNLASEDFPTNELTSENHLIEGLSEGSKLKFSIYSYTANLCTDELLKTVTVELPAYNDYYYYNQDKCLAYPEFKYCQEFYDIHDMNFSEIDKLYDKYVDSLTPNKQKTAPKFNLYLILGGSGLLIFLILIIIIIYKKRKNRDDL